MILCYLKYKTQNSKVHPARDAVGAAPATSPFPVPPACHPAHGEPEPGAASGAQPATAAGPLGPGWGASFYDLDKCEHHRYTLWPQPWFQWSPVTGGNHRHHRGFLSPGCRAPGCGSGPAGSEATGEEANGGHLPAQQ